MLQGSSVLVADDEKNGRRMLEILLSQLGCQVTTAKDGEEALDIIRKSSIDLVVSDLKMPNLDGLGLLAALRQAGNNVPVIIVTSFGSVESAVIAMKNGAFDFISRPYDIDQIELVVNHALQSHRLKQENDFLRAQLESNGWDEFVGESHEMRQVYHLIKQVAPTQANVFITGETGTGKELVARAIHKHSGRRGLFVAINCAALSASVAESELFGHVRGAFTGADKDRIGKFEFAHQGTLFLDEITEMHPDLQAKLLRVLQENTIERLGSNRSFEIDIRIIAASNRNLNVAVTEGYLRPDIYYRLNVFNINVPTLRNRADDILVLADTFIEKYRHKVGHTHNIQLSTTACELLTAYHWPGNVRELENIIERAVILCRDGIIDCEHLPHEISAENNGQFLPNGNGINLEGQVADLEINMIAKALESAEGNKAKAARILKISERTLWYKLKKHNIR